MNHCRHHVWALIASSLLLLSGHVAADSRLLATGGLTQVEGSAGGGLVPWAVLSGYGTGEETSATAFKTWVNLEDFHFRAYGLAASFHNRVELSIARQELDLQELTGKLRQNIYGLKVRLAGDVMYSDIPQLAVGVQYKRNQDHDLPRAVGSQRNSDFDYYASATKLFLGGAFGHNLLLNGTVRMTRANQLGLLGFGATGENDYKAMFEGSAGVFLNEHWAIGGEFRQKPDNLAGFDESHWRDLFVAWFPNKRVGLVAAYGNIGEIATFEQQSGLYLSAQVNLW